MDKIMKPVLVRLSSGKFEAPTINQDKPRTRRRNDQE